MLNGYNLNPLKKTLKEILIPTVGQAVLSLIIALALLFAVFFSFFAQLVVGDDAGSKYYFNEAISSYVATTNKTPISEHLGSIVIWGVVGAVAYIVILAVANIFVTGRNIVSDATQHDSFSLLDEYRRIVWMILSLLLIFLTLAVFMRSIFSIFQVGLENLNVFNLVIAPILLAINLYAVYMLTWVAIRNPNVLARN